MLTSTSVAKITRTAGIALVLAVAAIVVPMGGTAFASPSVSLTAGPYTNFETITVSGTGFPTRSADPSGLSIIECSDPGGTTANLPIDDTTCDATTANALPVLTDSTGAFSTTYSLIQLSTTGGNAINCDSTDFCVLWVGEDYVNAFTSNFSFSAPFEFGPATVTPETPFAIALPVGAAILIGGAVFVARRRRSSPTASMIPKPGN